ncbi:37S ribosomal protein S8, mitochondrial [Pseudocercospora fuligena]|uniref:37S ribosomal protein S8, mitochondrial n=1 Tax=Pseudocercospora fuligena TaxID=685502 RepID=A0A8H6RPP4_9PEZI|nr:37S ribosomal protein S8, mitochondrial [Pseudocercospora fuligena]
MSLVNLAHVCSHLQNASLARLGLTSIPYTKLHLSLALLLQKQGFLSQVKLGGPSPPASVFGQGPRDNHFLTNYPHGAAGRNRFSSEAALALVVRKGYTPAQLKAEGYGDEAIEFAEEHGRRTIEDLEKEGFAKQLVRLINDLRAQFNAVAEEKEDDYLQRREKLYAEDENGSAQGAIKALEESMGKTREERYAKWEEEFVGDLPAERATIYNTYRSVSRQELETTKFDPEFIRYIAGRSNFLTERELRLNGITIQAMGLPVTNQSITLPVEEYQDPAHMETEGIVTRENRASRRLWLGLKYYESSPVLSKAKMISKPTKRIWLNSRDLGKVVRGGQAGEVKALTRVGEIMAVSTDKGIMEARECVERKIGGMPLCRVW